MARFKILTIIFCLFLTQAVLSKPIDDSSEESSEEDVEALLEELKINGTDSEKLILSRMGNYALIPQKFTAKAVNASKYLLRDEALMANKHPEILEFKKNLTMFVNKYDPATNLKAMHETMDIFVNTTHHYLELAEEKITPESKFIIELLTKYDIKDYAVRLENVEAAVDEWRITGTAAEKLLLFVLDSFFTIPQQYAANATNATQYLLKDVALKENTKTEVEEFKKKLNGYLENNVDLNFSSFSSIYASIKVFNNITDFYYQLPAAKVTEDTKFIVDLMKKYNFEKYSIKLNKYFNRFMEDFTKMFEEFKVDLDQTILDWFEKFSKIKVFTTKLQSIEEFIKLVHE